MRTFFSLLMALILVFTCSGAKPSRSDSSPAWNQSSQQDRGNSTLSDHAPNFHKGAPSWENIAYVHYDPESFYEGVENLLSLAGSGDSQSVIEWYDRLYNQLVTAFTQSTISFIHYSGDVTDAYWSKESLYCQSLYTQMEDRFLTACDLTEVFVSYQPITEREAELLEEESALIDQYYDYMEDAQNTVYNYNGENWDLEKITGPQGIELVGQNYEGYLEIFFGIQQSVCSQMGPLYTRMVEIRSELAQLYGYDNFTDYAYDLLYGRDYTAEQAQKLCDDVKPLSRTYYNIVSSRKDRDAAASFSDQEALLAAMEKVLAKLDPSLLDSWRFLRDHHLIDIGRGGTRMEVSYTTYLSEYEEPFLFSTLFGDEMDLSTLIHEFGHFEGYLCSPPPNILIGDGSYDLMEIHSTALEALSTFCYEDVYPEGAEAMRSAVLGQLLESVVNGCIFDELQRRVYEQPDMTSEQISSLYASICSEYGIYEPLGIDYAWVYISHNFDAPLYYISYAASALAAMQIWDTAQNDLTLGVELWEEILDHDAFTESYAEVLHDCGLLVFTEENAVQQICSSLLAVLQEDS